MCPLEAIPFVSESCITPQATKGIATITVTLPDLFITTATTHIVAPTGGATSTRIPASEISSQSGADIVGLDEKLLAWGMVLVVGLLV